ncbi:hypothetical protein KBZ21_50125, partial [Streptomyces sp. A73]|nr:hypothetical protein [Streptomyces sp. A73]
PRDVLALLAQAGWEPDEVDLDGPLIQWRGGGPDVWQPSGSDREWLRWWCMLRIVRVAGVWWPGAGFSASPTT